MDDTRIGRTLRALRHRLGWRQLDLAGTAGVSQDVVSRVERGRIGAMPLAKLRRVARALDADLVVFVRWRGGELDRLLDEGHASLVGALIAMLEAAGWVVQPEVSYSEFGERGSIDVLAWHPVSRCLLVIEVKTELTSVEETLRKHDEKVRLAPRIAAERFGWRPAAVGRLLVLPSTATPRRAVARHRSILTRAYPLRGDAVRRWLREASSTAGKSAMGGILFVSPTHGVRGRRGAISRKRIRRPGTGDTTHGVRR